MDTCKNCEELEKFYKQTMEAFKTNLLHMGKSNESYKTVLNQNYDLLIENIDLQMEVIRLKEQLRNEKAS